MATIPSEGNQAVEIAPFNYDDIDEIMAIENVSFSAPWTQDSYLDLAPLETISFYVVKLQGRVVGYMLYQTWAEEMELHTIAVAPAHRRQGLAKKMMEHIIHDASTRGVERIFLQVRPSNEAARSLYQSFGFYIIGIRKRYYRDNQEDAEVMRLDLKHET